eukprot:gnl/TRDRNA2_/TRDRNA2_145128_c0_seq1.p1 gnl/TRDRNA2_/TRDRNA2_145128_c0~~gnl/TRDRNA2_/TRDRNA2_145128_c0_seq1.p1  ORF type:complete len:253 (+),score=37.75 gnl/TRDRNA2_/TRDRNA2_145128_c0_seq1:43-801(+)
MMDNSEAANQQPGNGFRVGDSVCIFSTKISDWFPGTVIGFSGDQAKVMYHINDKVYTKVYSVESPCLRRRDQDGTEDKRLEGELPEQYRLIGTSDKSTDCDFSTDDVLERKTISIGCNVRIWSCKAGGHIDAVVTSISSTGATCTYFVNMCCCMKTLPLDCLELCDDADCSPTSLETDTPAPRTSGQHRSGFASFEAAVLCELYHDQTSTSDSSPQISVSSVLQCATPDGLCDYPTFEVLPESEIEEVTTVP